MFNIIYIYIYTFTYTYTHIYTYTYAIARLAVKLALSIHKYIYLDRSYDMSSTFSSTFGTSFLCCPGHLWPLATTSIVSSQVQSSNSQAVSSAVPGVGPTCLRYPRMWQGRVQMVQGSLVRLVLRDPKGLQMCKQRRCSQVTSISGMVWGFSENLSCFGDVSLSLHRRFGRRWSCNSWSGPLEAVEKWSGLKMAAFQCIITMFPP